MKAACGFAPDYDEDFATRQHAAMQGVEKDDAGITMGAFGRYFKVYFEVIKEKNPEAHARWTAKHD